MIITIDEILKKTGIKLGCVPGCPRRVLVYEDTKYYPTYDDLIRILFPDFDSSQENSKFPPVYVQNGENFLECEFNLINCGQLMNDTISDGPCYYNIWYGDTKNKVRVEDHDAYIFRKE